MTPKQRRALAAILTEPTLERAAEMAGVGARTLRRWRSEPAFAVELKAAGEAAFEHALARVQALAGEAVDTLRSVMRDPEASASARVSAARAVLERADRDAPRPEAPAVDSVAESEAAVRAALAAELATDELRELDALAERVAERRARETQPAGGPLSAANGRS